MRNYVLMRSYESWLFPVLISVLVGFLAACGSSNLPPDERPIPSQLPMDQRAQFRKLPLDGASNFRDLGGYETVDGRHVKWGLLYRSGKLADLSDADLIYLKRLHLRRIVDFRSAEEREAEPDLVPQQDPPITQVWAPVIVEGASLRAFRKKMLSGKLDRTEMAQLLVKGNRHFVTDFSSVYGPFLRDLAKPGNLPTVFHCTAGKDRAGFGAAVVLLALGVPRQTVIRDFMLTNVYTADYIEKTMWKIRIFSLFRTNPEDLRPVLGIRREYVEAALETMDKEYGSVDNYIRQGLGVDDALREKLRAVLLE